MAEKYYTAASGNWSTAANWNGGTVPGTGDDVYANGKTITIDQDITCLKITTAAGATAVAGGGFLVSASGRTINANVTAGTTKCLYFTITSGTCIVNGNVVGGSAAGAYGVDGTYSGSMTLTINGTLQSGSNSTAYGFNQSPAGTPNTSLVVNGNVTAISAHCINKQYGTGSITINGNVQGSNTAASCVGIYIGAQSGATTVNGNVTGGSQTAAHGYQSLSGQTGTLTIGSAGSPVALTGGTGVSCCGIILQGSEASVTIYGTITGGNNVYNTVAGLYILSTTYGNVTIVGNVTGGPGGSIDCNGIKFGAFNLSSTVTITGDITAGAVGSGLRVTATTAGVITVNGEAIGNTYGTGSSDSVAYAIEVVSKQPIVKVRSAKCGTNGMWPISGPCFISNIHQGSVKVKNSLLNEGIYELPRPKGNTMGDYQVGDVIYRHHTFRTTPASLTVAVYPDDSTTEITTGVTVTYSGGFDSVAGLVSVKVDTASGYTAGKDYTIVATGGTVYGDAIAGTVLGAFSLAKQSLSTAAGIRSAVGLASANLDTQLSTIAGYVDTEVTASAIRAAIGLASANLDTQLGTIDDFLDTEIAAIKAKTDNLPSDPADASDIASSFATVNSTLATLSAYVDTEVAAIKAKTDALPADTATVLSDMPKSVWNFDLLANIATTVNRYSPWNAMRHVLCKWSIASTTKTVYKEDGSTTAYTTTVTSDASGISGDTP